MDLKTFYTPIVKGNENDFKAIGKMPKALASRTLPLFELLAPDDVGTFDDALFRFASRLRKHCPLQRFSVDLHAIPPSEKIADGSPSLETMCSCLRSLGVQFVPVFGFDHEPELWERIARIARKEGRGLTFRLHKEDLLVPDATLEELLDHLAQADIGSQEVNLMIDLGSLNAMSKAELASMRSQAQDFIDLAITARTFGLVSLVGSSMPKDVGEVPKEGQAAIPRNELPLWLEVCASLDDVPIAFGDYGVVHPNFSIKAPATHANAKIRYTSTRSHHIFRGHSVREGNQFGQYRDLSKSVIGSAIYKQRDYSYGDDYIWRCAHGETGTGHLGTWVEVDMNHHFVFTTDQLSRIENRVAAGVSIADIEAIVQ